jgi:hypothetical protein
MGNCASVGGWPLMKNESGFMSFGEISRESIVVIRPLRPSRNVMKPPPPRPQLYGSTTPSTLAAAIAPSNALPPRLSTSIAALVASGSTLAAAPPVPLAVGCFSWATATGALSATHATATPSSVLTRRIIPIPPGVIPARTRTPSPRLATGVYASAFIPRPPRPEDRC